VRELLNVLRRAVLFAETPELDLALVRRMLAASVFGHGTSAPAPSAVLVPSGLNGADADGLPTNLAEMERTHITRVLTQMDGNITRAATALGIDRRTLQRKLRAFGLPADD
jgi:DNA-binding NtrC family response regulator